MAPVPLMPLANNLLAMLHIYGMSRSPDHAPCREGVGHHIQLLAEGRYAAALEALCARCAAGSMAHVSNTSGTARHGTAPSSSFVTRCADLSVRKLQRLECHRTQC